MTTGIPLLQPALARTAAASLAAQLPPKSARLDAPEPRSFDAALRDAGRDDKLTEPPEAPKDKGGVESPDDKAPDEPSKKDGATGADAGTKGEPGGETKPDETEPKPGDGSKPQVSETPGDNPGGDKKTSAANETPKDKPAGDTPAVKEKPGGETPPDVKSGGTDGGKPDGNTPPGGVPKGGGEVNASEGQGGARPGAPAGQTPDAPNSFVGAGEGARPGAGDAAARPVGEGAPTPTQPPLHPTEQAAKFRFDESVRVQVKHAARVDLDQIAADELASPVRTRPGGGDATPAPPRSERADPSPEQRRASAGDTPAADARRAPTRQAPVNPGQVGIEQHRAQRTETISVERGQPTPQAPRAPAGGADTSTGGNQQGRTGGNGQAFTGAPASVPASARGRSATGDAASFRASLQNLQSVGGGKSVPRPQGADPVPLSAKPRPPSPGKGESAAKMMAQVSRGVASILRHKGGSLTLRLSPRSLGELKISMRVENGGVHASFKPTEPQARELLRSNLDSLRQTLEQHGVRVERLSVEGGANEPRDAAHARAESPHTRGDGTPERESPMESGGDGRSPHHQWHGGRSGGGAGGGPRENQDHRSGVGDAAGETDDGVTAGAASAHGEYLGLDTLA